MDSRIGVSLISNDVTHRQALAASIASQIEFKVISQEAEGSVAVEAARTNPSDVTVLATHSPAQGGCGLIRRLRTEVPGSRILVLSPTEDSERVTQALKAGAAGYLSTRSGVSWFF